MFPSRGLRGMMMGVEGAEGSGEGAELGSLNLATGSKHLDLNNGRWSTPPSQRKPRPCALGGAEWCFRNSEWLQPLNYLNP